MKVGIVGYGYVGARLESTLWNYRPEKHDPEKGWSNERKINECDVAFICVPTPDKNGVCDTSIVESCVEWIETPLIVIKSTVPPGTTDRLRERTGKLIHFSPEFVVERTGQEINGHVIVGGPRADLVLDAFTPIMPASTRFVACRAIEAELVKYLANAYFATKVTLFNEYARMAAAFGVDYKTARELLVLDPRIEPDHTLVFTEDPGFGGKCLPKDLNGIIAASLVAGFTPELLCAVRSINDRTRGERRCPTVG